MPDGKKDLFDASQLRQRALSRWENEGGASECGAPMGARPVNASSDDSDGREARKLGLEDNSV